MKKSASARPASDPLTEVERARRLLRLRPRASRAVHEARRSLNRARAVLKLGRGGAHEKSCLRAEAACRRAARALAQPRDAGVYAAVLENLLERGADELSREALALGRRRAARARRAAARALAAGAAARRADAALGSCPRRLGEGSFRRAVSASLADGLRRSYRRCRRADAALRSCPRRLGEGSFRRAVSASLADGLRRSYRRCRRAYRAARARAEEEAFHDLRKAAKRLLHELEWLSPPGGCAPAAAREDLRKLAKLLGDENDLALLRRGLGSGTGGRPLRRLARRRQRRLRRRALRIGKRAFAQRPASFARFP